MPADRTERKPAAYEQTTVTCAEPCLCSCHKKGADCSMCNIPISEIHQRARFAGGGKGQGWSAQEREFGKEILRLTTELARVTKERDEANAELAKRKSFMNRAGFRECDIAACNCDEWHNPHMSALSDALDERVSELATLKQERDELRARIAKEEAELISFLEHVWAEDLELAGRKFDRLLAATKRETRTVTRKQGKA